MIETRVYEPHRYEPEETNNQTVLALDDTPQQFITQSVTAVPEIDRGECAITDEQGLVTAISCPHTTPKCSRVNPVPAQIGEYLPFWLDVEFNEDIDPTAQSCEELKT